MVDAVTAARGADARRGRLAELLRLHSIPGLGRARAARWIRAEGGIGRALASGLQARGYRVARPLSTFPLRRVDCAPLGRLV